MMNFLSLLTTFFFLNREVYGQLQNDQTANYTGCQLLSVKPETDHESQLLRALFTANDPGMEFWEYPRKINETVAVQLCPSADTKTFEQLKSINYSVQIEDIQELIDEQAADNELLGRFDSETGSVSDFVLGQYHPLNEIQNFYRVALRDYPELIKMVNIGYSVKGQPLQVLQVSDGNSNRTKGVIWVDAGIHAREWVTIASTLYIINQMLTANDTVIQEILKDYDWHFLPVVNPDGYEFSFKKNRLWRKNRSSGLLCNGVDLNRNFDIDFKRSGILAKLACSQEYQGSAPFSEPETKAVSSYLSGIKNRLKAYLSLHSYGQLWLSPYGYRQAKPVNYQSLINLSRKIASAIYKVDRKDYTIGTVYERLYHVTGGSADWVYDKLGVKYSFAIELRDKGQHGFLLPKEEIIPTAKELIAAFHVLVHNI